MRRTVFLIWALLSVAAACLSACSDRSSAAPSPSSQPIPIEFLDGSTDVAVDASFQATFGSDTNMSTVTETTFFIVETTASANIASATKAEGADLQLCNAANRVSASVATTGFVTVLTPAGDLASATRYTVCVVNVKKTDGSAIDEFGATFLTAVAASSGGVAAAILDAKGALLATTGSTDVALSPIYLLFSEAMNAASVTTAGNITLTCHSNMGDVTPAITVAQAPTFDGTSDQTYLLTVTDAYSYQLLGCTLALTANVKTSAGTAIGAASYAFTAGCALMDDFRSNTQGCWTVPPAAIAGATWNSWTELNTNGISIPGTGSFVYAPPVATASRVVLLKTATFTDSGFSLSVGITVPVTGVTQLNEWIGLALANTADTTNYLIIGLDGDSGHQYCNAEWSDPSQGVIIEASALCPPSAETYTVSVTVDTTNGMTASYRVGSGAAVALVPGAGSFPTAANVQEKLLDYSLQDWYLTLSFKNVSSGPQALITRVQTSGISSETHY